MDDLRSLGTQFWRGINALLYPHHIQQEFESAELNPFRVRVFYKHRVEMLLQANSALLFPLSSKIPSVRAGQ